MIRKRIEVDTVTLDLFADGGGEGGASEELTAARFLEVLRLWADAGILRQLDVAMAAFLQEHDASAQPCVLIATALLAHMEGRGHSCLPVAELLANPAGFLGWSSVERGALESLWRRLPAGVEQWIAALQASPMVRLVETTQDRGQPLVLAGSDGAGPLLYLRRYWDHERLVSKSILNRTAAPSGAIDVALTRGWLDKLFPTKPESGTCNWQKVACALALRGRFAVITGGPGTGKTYTAARLLALLFATSSNADQLRVALSAPTGKAAARLKQAIDGALVELKSQVGSSLDLDTLVQRVGPARTLHSLLGARSDTRHFAYNAGRPLDLDVLIVDEASMVHLEMMAALLDALPAHTRLILLGDKDQLASVEAGAVLGDLCRDARAGKYSPETAAFLTEVAGEIIPDDYLEMQTAPTLAQQTTMLRQSRRFGGPIGQLATAVNEGKAPAAVALLHEGMEKDGDASEIAFQEGGAADQIVSLALHGRGGSASYATYAHELSRWPDLEKFEGLKDAHAEWVKGVLKGFDRFRLLCAVRDGDWGVSGLNSAVEKALERNRHIRRAGEWYPGRPVMVTRNDAALGVFNGDIGIALPSVGDGHPLRVYFLQGDQLRSVGVTRLAHVETAFAMTVHKSQGSEFEHSAVILSAAAGGILGRELVYTGITRARKTFTLLAERPGLLEQAIASPTKRTSGLPRFLDREFAEGPEAR
jgi:exodeoxyribonuclease V alpha subunit